MNWNRKQILGAVVVGMALLGSRPVFAQAQGAQQPPSQAPAPAEKGKSPAPAAPLTLETLTPPVNAEEDAAIKAFREAPLADVQKKDQLGEEFVQKYPQSRYRTEVYSWLVRGYLSTGQIDKMQAAGEKELALNPNDPQTLAIIGSTLPRAMNASTPDQQKRLDQAEEYCKKALELLPTFPKPADVTEETFTTAKNQTSAMAYSGLGLVAFRRGKYAEAIPNLEQALKLDTAPDPVNYFILGICNEKASHFDDAVTAFTKCAAFPGGLQATCKSSIEEAKKLAATQLSVPK